MKRTVLSYLFIALLSCLTAHAASYTELWNMVAAAERADKPRTQLALLTQIAAKAGGEKRYGHLLKAELRMLAVRNSISADSLPPAVERLEARTRQADEADVVLASVYHSVLGQVYKTYRQLGDDRLTKAKHHFCESLTYPLLLARVKATDYVPLMTEGYDSRIFGDDLLSVLSYEARSFDVAHQYYATHHNRAATMLMALNILRQHRPADTTPVEKCSYIVSLDSLVSLYSDLRPCGEVAIERYRHMSRCPGTTDRQRLQYIDYAIGKWGGWPALNTLRNERKRLTCPTIEADMQQTKAAPGQSLWLRLKVRNADRVNVTVTPVNADGLTTAIGFNPSGETDYASIRKKLVTSSAYTVTRRYSGIPEHVFTADSVELKTDRPGLFLVQVATQGSNVKPLRFMLHVTRMALLAQELPQRSIRLAAVDALTGQPIPGAGITLEHIRKNLKTPAKTVTLTTDSRGEAVCRYSEADGRPEFVYVSGKGDTAFPKSPLYAHFYSRKPEATVSHTNLYTDRALYRPGQTVNVALLAYTADSPDRIQPATGEAVTLLLRDANYKEVARRQLTTDQWGTAAATFTLPQNSLNGLYRIETEGHGSVSFRVEEYKRPTFRVDFPTVNQAYHDGDTLVVTARATTYAGTPVQNAKVCYTVRRNQRLWWRGLNPMNGTSTLLTDTLQTDSAGAFRIEMPMLLPPNLREADRGLYDITAEVQVTDQAGESRGGTLSLPLSRKSTFLSCDLPRQAERDSLKTVTFRLRNTAMLDIDAPVTFTLGGHTHTARTNKPYDLTAAGLASGRHTMLAVCEGDTIRQEITLFSMADTRPVTKTDEWFYTSATQFPADGRPVYVQAGASDSLVHMLYTVISGDSLLESGVISLSDSLYTRRLEDKACYGESVMLNFAWMKDGRMHSYSTTIRRPRPDRRLTLSWTTFRDRLQPGQSETWRLSITTPDGKPAQAHLMATMYDKSLDQIAPHSWTLTPLYPTGSLFSTWCTTDPKAFREQSAMAYKYLTDKTIDLTRIDYSPLNMFSGRVLSAGVMRKNVLVRGGAVQYAADELAAPMAMESLAVTDNATSTTSEAQADTPQMRENMSETALFMPSLTADDKGQISLSFTLPQSVTTWRLMGVAHDMQMRHGTIEAEAVATKTVMIQPNMPRFLRMGDQAVITARLTNTSDKTITGRAQLDIIDPVTLRTLSRTSTTYTVKGGTTEPLSFTLDTEALQRAGAENLVICRISAEGDGYSDGEQHYLPLLPNTERVVSTQSFYIDGAGTKTINLKALTGGNSRATDRKVTVEYTANPAWLMVQALPALAEPQSDNAISLVSAYYATGMASSIVGNSPRVRAVIEQWKQETGSETSLMSPLQTNRDVKNIMLSETPWVAEAETEAEQRRSLSTLFDTANQSARQATLLDKLGKLQNADGSFSWYPGMNGTLHITMSVAQTLIRLHTITGSAEAQAVTDRAMGWIAQEMVKRVNTLKKRNSKPGTPEPLSGDMLQYLYIRSMYSARLPKATAEADRYLIGLLKTSPVQTQIYDKALAAVILAHSGDKAKAGEYVESIRQYTVQKDGMGRYFDTDRAAYSWQDLRIPTQVAAIEAIQAVEPRDTATVNEMRLWLLRQKQTQMWSTPVSSVDAIHAFFASPKAARPSLDILSATAKVIVTADNRRIDTPQTAGLGYTKVTLPDAEAKTLTIQTTGGALSWGAVYATETMPVDRITSASDGLTVSRKVVADKNMKVGDRITVRLTVKADRDYQFVTIEDRRPACLEPVAAISRYTQGCYRETKDNATRLHFDTLRKGTHTFDIEYYIDREGTYRSGTATAQCAYAPQYAGREKSYSMGSNE